MLCKSCNQNEATESYKCPYKMKVYIEDDLCECCEEYQNNCAEER